MSNDSRLLLTVDVRLMAEPCLWCWELVDVADGQVVECSWDTYWTAYEASREALRAGLSRLVEVTRGGRAPTGTRRASTKPGGPLLCHNLVIVARSEPQLHLALTAVATDTHAVEVVLDRRVGDRRRRSGVPPVLDRRRGDRRAHPDIDHHLGTRGWAIVRRVETWLAVAEARTGMVEARLKTA
jgi:hypothetical protein